MFKFPKSLIIEGVKYPSLNSAYRQTGICRTKLQRAYAVGIRNIANPDVVDWDFIYSAWYRNKKLRSA